MTFSERQKWQKCTDMRGHGRKKYFSPKFNRFLPLNWKIWKKSKFEKSQNLKKVKIFQKPKISSQNSILATASLQNSMFFVVSGLLSRFSLITWFSLLFRKLRVMRAKKGKKCTSGWVTSEFCDERGSGGTNQRSQLTVFFWRIIFLSIVRNESLRVSPSVLAY